MIWTTTILFFDFSLRFLTSELPSPLHKPVALMGGASTKVCFFGASFRDWVLGQKWISFCQTTSSCYVRAHTEYNNSNISEWFLLCRAAVAMAAVSCAAIAMAITTSEDAAHQWYVRILSLMQKKKLKKAKLSCNLQSTIRHSSNKHFKQIVGQNDLNKCPIADDDVSYTY